MNSFELARDSFNEAIKTSNPVTAVSRCFNKSIAIYCQAASIDGSFEDNEYGKHFPFNKILVKITKRKKNSSDKIS